MAQAPKKIIVEHSDYFDVNQIEAPDAALLTGNVRVNHDGVIMTCNKAYYFQKENYIKAFGNVQLVQGDTLYLNSKYAEYNGNVKQAFATGDAIMRSPESTFDFVPLDARKVLVVLVSTGGHISHKVIEPSEPFGTTELQQAANFINTEFKGHSLSEVRQAVFDRLREDQTTYGELMSRALRLASSSFEGLERQPSIYIQGTALLFEVTAGHDPESTLATMKSLVHLIEEKTRLVQLIDACMDGSGLTVFIGSEHQDPDLQHFSVVTSTYTDGKRRGAVGIIGPTRMRYSRAINVVDSLSRTINRVFDNS